MSRSPRHRRSLIETLEPRLLFSATADIAVFDDGSSDANHLAQAAEQVDLVGIYLPQEQVVTDSPTNDHPVTDADNDDDTQPQYDLAAHGDSTITTLVFVDTTVDNYEALVEDIRSRVDTNSVAILYLDSSKDGLEQISGYLAGFSGISAVHIISHSVAGNLQLGSQVLNENNLGQFKQQLTAWQTALDGDADILLYGCDLAANDSGVNLLRQLSDMTGADVAASNDLTGNNRAGANWELEEEVGQVETQSLFLAQQASMVWQGVLADIYHLNSGPPTNEERIPAAGHIKQGVQLTTNQTIDRVQITLANHGTISSDVVMTIRQSTYDGALVATSSVKTNTLGSSLGQVNFDFKAFTLSAYYVYWIDFRTNDGADNLVGLGYINQNVISGEFVVNFAGDSTRDMSIALIDVGNRAPAVVTPIPDQTTTEAVLYSYTVPINTFSDLDGDALTYTATLTNGGALPAWLTFNPATRTFSGQANDGDVASLNIRVTATDAGGQSIFDDFNLNVTNLAEPPYVVNPIPDQAAQGFTPFSYQFASNTFGDPEGNAITSYRATLADGSALPSWLSFDSASRTFSGTPSNADAGTIAIRVYATDSTGLESTAPDQFNIVVTASVNDAPVNTVPGAQSTNEDTALVFNLANGNRIQIADPDAWSSSVQVSLSVANGVLTLAGTAGLSFTIGDGTNDANLVFTGTIANINAALATLTYTPTANYTGSDTLNLVTNDLGNSGTGGAKTDSDTVAITVNAVNDAPVNSVPGGQVGTEDVAFVFSAAKGNQIQINDIDVGSGNLQVNLSVTNGTLTLAGTSGLSFTTGDGTADGSMVFTGTRAAINTALATLTFNPTANYNGGAVVSLTTSDLGNTGSGGAKTDADSINILLTQVNDAPTVTNTIPDQNATEDVAFSFQFASNTFSDIDAGTNLIYSTSALPSWLTFNAATRTFSGTPLNAHVGPVSITVTASDGSLSVSDTFVITVINANDAPVVANLIPNQNATEDSPFSFQFASNTFMDPDPGVPNLTYTATLGNNSPLPGWLSFDAATRTFSGTPLNANVGTISVKVTASDPSGAVAFDIFDITVANTNDAPVVANPIPDQNATEGKPFNFSFASNTFTDPDPGSPSLTYTAQLPGAPPQPLPGWLSFNPLTRTFTGTPPNGASDIDVEVIASDGSLTTSDTFRIAITPVDDSPVLVIPIPNQNATEDVLFNFQFNSETFSDPDPGDVLTYSATMADGSPLVTWLQFDAANRRFYGTPTNSDVDTISVKVTAADLNGGPVASDTFDIIIANTDDAPTVATPIGNQTATEDSPFNFTFGAGTFTDQDVGDANNLTYSTSALPTWLSFDPATRTFSGTPSNADVTPIGTPVSITVTATDPSGLSVTDTFTIAVVNTNDAPEVNEPLVDQSATQGQAFSYPFASDTFIDPDGNVLTYSARLSNGDPLPAWLSFDSATRTFSGTPGNEDVQLLPLSIEVTANDGFGGTVTDSFELQVSNTNDAPVVIVVPTDYDALEQVAIDLHGTGIVVADADGDLLTVTLTGQYTNSNLAATAGTTGVIIVSGVNTKTLTLSGTATQFNDLFAGNNGGTLTYWMSGDMPVATDLLTISVSDGTLTSSDTAVINITAVNDGPTNDVPLASQVTNEDTPLVFSAANGNQIQVNDLDAGSAELEVTLSVTNGTLTLAGVGGLVFTAGTGAGDSSLVFRGTQANINAALATLTFNPTTNYSGAALLTITTSDLGNQGVGGTLTDSDNVSIIVNPVNDGPVVASPIPNRVALEDAAFNFQFAVGAFADVDGDLLTYTTNSLPAWLSFDAATRTFSGTPMNSDIGPITINVTATDGDGLSVTDSFIIDVVNVNDAPTVQISLTQYFANEQVPIDLHGTGILVADVDNSLLTVTLNADGNNCTFAATAGSTGVVIVEGMNTNNLILTGTAAQLNDLFAGNNGATLRYLHVDDIVVPTCLVTISASDGTLTGSATTTIYITAVNDAPVNTIPPAQTTDEDTALIFGLANNNQIQINDLDVVGSELEMTLSVTNGTLTLAGVAGLSFSSGDGTADGSMVFRGTQTAINAALATLTFNPNVSYTGAALLTITTSDLGNTGAGGVLTDTDTVNITINATNDAPVIANPIADQYAAEDAAFSFQFAANTFSDADVNDTLIYSAQAGGGGALPAWLSFDPLTRTFSGTPANSDVGTVIVDVIANDNNGGTVTDTFVITVTNTNDAPVVANPIADQMAIQGSPFGFTVPTNAFTDLDGDTLSYSARLSGGAALPAWLVFDAATRTFSGTPANGDVGTLAVEVVVIDGNGGSTSDTFDLVVDDLNDPPVLAIPIANQNALEDTAFSFQFAANTFADPDPGTTLAYSAQLASGGALPAWLIFDAATRTFSGTPANGDVGVLSIRVIASDGIASASADFQLTVAAVNDAPVALGIAPINTQEDAAGSSVDLWTAFSDEDHPSNQLQYSVVNNSNPGLVSSATIDPATGKLHITYAANQFGAGSLVIRAQDPLGANVETTVQINVASVNDVPTTTGIADQQVLASDAPPQINLHSVFSDIENGTGLTYLVTGNTNPMVTPTISIDPVTGVMTVVFAPTVGGQSTITLRATDAEGAWVETQFKVSVTSLIILLPILPEEPVAPVIPPVVTPIEPPVVEPPVIAPPVDSGGGGPIAPDNPADDLGSLLPGVGPGADQEDSSNFVQGGDKSIRDYLRVDEQINSKNATLGSLTTSASLVNMIRPDGGFAPWEQEEFDNEVRRIRTQMDEALEIEYERNAVVAGLTFSITTGLLVWSLRASTLLLTMMSMLPLWRGIDPLPILDEVDKKKKELEQQRKDREREDKSKKEVGYLFDHAHRKEPR